MVLHRRQARTWKSIFLKEVSDRIDANRVHFTGRLAYRDYLKALQISSAHVYLTYPFVLSWSCIEALSCGCMVIGSDTTPVREVINGENGVLVPFFDHEQLANRQSKHSPSRADFNRCARRPGAPRSNNSICKPFLCRRRWLCSAKERRSSRTKNPRNRAGPRNACYGARAAIPSSSWKAKLDRGRPTPAWLPTPAPAHRVPVQGHRANAASLVQRLISNASDQAGSCADASPEWDIARSSAAKPVRPRG